MIKKLLDAQLILQNIHNVSIRRTKFVASIFIFTLGKTCSHISLFFTIIFLLSWKYIVAFTKVLTMYQIYQTWIHPLHHFPFFSLSQKRIASVWNDNKFFLNLRKHLRKWYKSKSHFPSMWLFLQVLISLNSIFLMLGKKILLYQYLSIPLK
jgi:hypothetical protein